MRSGGVALKRAGLIIVLILTWVPVPSLAGAEAQPPARPLSAVAATEAEDAQLRVLRTALMQGPTTQSRVDAAVVLLGRSDQPARAVLVSGLLAKDNPDARRAVCRGLIRSRAVVGTVGRPDAFLEPLMGLLLSESPDEVRLASEALLVFEYEQIGPRLVQWARSGEMETRVRLNVVYALSLWPRKEAIGTLIDLVDDPDPQVAARARDELHEAFGIPAGTDPQTFRGILEKLQAKSPPQIIRDLMAAQRERAAAQNERMRRLAAERDLWRGKYLTGLDRDYARLDEAGKAKMLIEKLSSEWPAEKLWALDKVSAYPGSVPQELRVLLLASVTDSDRDVRLAAAKVLAGKSALDPAQVLLKQLEVETDREVATAIFDALGEACFFAFSPGSPIKLDPAIRDRTLELAAEYLAAEDGRMAAQGADVLRKLVGLDGLTDEAVERYTRLLANTYTAARETRDETARVALLNAMAHLADRPRVQAAADTLFRPLFEQALQQDSANGLRQAAATGLLSLDKTAAMAFFREKDLQSDRSAAVRRVVISAAAQAGDERDLTWLSGLLGPNGEAEVAWQAMRAILDRQNAATVLAWAKRLSKLEARYRELLTLADGKAEAAKDTGVQTAIRLLLLDAHLDASDVPKAAGVFTWRLLRQNDITAADPFVQAVERWLARPDVDAARKTLLLDTLAGVKKPDQAQWTQWMATLKDWQTRFGSAAGEGGGASADTEGDAARSSGRVPAMAPLA